MPKVLEAATTPRASEEITETPQNCLSFTSSAGNDPSSLRHQPTTSSSSPIPSLFGRTSYSVTLPELSGRILIPRYAAETRDRDECGSRPQSQSGNFHSHAHTWTSSMADRKSTIPRMTKQGSEKKSNDLESASDYEPPPKRRSDVRKIAALRAAPSVPASDNPVASACRQ